MSFRRYFAFAPVFMAVGWAIQSAGCAAAESKRATAGSVAPPAPGEASGAAGGGGEGGRTTSSNSGGFVIGGEGGGETSLNPDDSCASTSAEATLIPLDMVILLDRSGSMLGSKWHGVTNAITTFVNDGSSAGMRVGLTYFPRGLAGQNDCQHTTYGDLAVPIGELPMNAAPVNASIRGTSPSGGTPMRPALQGVLFNATAYQDANPAHKVIVVLATDGDPSGCSDNTVDSTAELAERALNYNGVQTFVIAVEGSTIANLNQIAAAGGTTRAYDVTSDIADFSAKMAEIQASALPCELLIPPPPTGESLDVSRVAVRYKPGAGAEIEIPKADDASDCGGAPGWYYNSGVDPDKIILCPASCAAVQSDAQAKLDVLFGCEPRLN